MFTREHLLEIRDITELEYMHKHKHSSKGHMHGCTLKHALGVEYTLARRPGLMCSAIPVLHVVTFARWHLVGSL